MSHYRTVSVKEEDVHDMSPIPSSSARPVSHWMEDDLIDMYRTNSAESELDSDPPNLSTDKITAALSTPPRSPVTRQAMMQPRQRRRRRRKCLITLGVLSVVVLAVVIPVVLSLTHKTSHSSSSNSTHATPRGPTTGTTGSLITMDDGTQFTYTNAFGGDWAEDPTKPFSLGGKAQEWSPRVGTEEWVWGKHIARGVNLGGWLVTEPFITPALYEKYVNNSAGIVVVDEWTLCLAMGTNMAPELINHYKTFITEQDFANIAAAGLNWVRIPIGFWVIEAINDEPFLVGTSWTYFLKAIQWARKYGIRIYMDLHALPGSQNGWNHSGKAGSINFMNGVMGIANAQRTLTYLRILTEFASQEQYHDVIGVIGIVNEILYSTIGKQSIQSFYMAAYQAIRTSTGVGAGRGPYIAIHEAFQGLAIWEGFLSGADRLALDQHPYLAFTYDYVSTIDQMAVKPCSWAVATNQSSKAFGVTLGGEFSAAINDCGYWLNGIGSKPGAPDCSMIDNWAAYNATFVQSLKQVTLATMDALQNFWFWTWKIGNSTVLGTSSNPLWHYQLGLEKGWIPADPREAIGHCASVLASSQTFDGTYASSATGFGPATLDPGQTTSYVFPPTTLSPSFAPTMIGLLPTYTATGKLTTLFAPTFTAAPTAAVGIGWNNSADTQLAFVAVAGCTYPNPWNAVNASVPTATCTG